MEEKIRMWYLLRLKVVTEVPHPEREFVVELWSSKLLEKALMGLRFNGFFSGLPK